MIEIEMEPPDFCLAADYYSTVSGKDLKGMRVALYLYPKIKTSG